MDLDEKCIKLLLCLQSKNDTLNLSQISVLTHFSNNDILERLVFMWKNEYIRVVACKQPEFLPMDGRFQITAKGKIYLETIAKAKKARILEWIWRAIPIIISLLALAKSYHWL
ncbi:hypothetical protein SCACP_30280 [Sporomusa carbonis]|uniref:hypothetical protein n=1 Tax=Sporomusa carbonis TaxID=3076075 RepID=UPI003A6E9311